MKPNRLLAKLALLFLCAALASCYVPRRPEDFLKKPLATSLKAATASIAEVSEEAFDRQDELRALLQRNAVPPVAVTPPAKPDYLASRKLSLSMQNARVGQLLWILASEFQISLSVEPAVLSMPTTINLHLQKVTGREALDHIVSVFDISATMGADRVLVVKLMQEKVIDLGTLTARSSLEITSGGDAFGGNKDSTTGMKNNMTMRSEVGDKSEPIDQLVKTIESVMSEGAANAAQPAANGAEKPKFSINRASGTLFVRARPSAVRALENLIEKETNFRQRQIQIEAQLIDVQLNDQSRLGIDWNLFGRRVLGRFGSEPMTIGSAAGAVTDIVLPTGRRVTVPGQSLGTTGATAGGLGYRTNTFSLAVNALKTFGAVRVLSNPSVLVRNGTPAYLNVGTSIRYIQKITANTTNNGSTSQTTTDVVTDSLFSGVVVGVNAVVKKDGVIELFIYPNQTQVQEGTLDPVDVGSGNKVTLPRVNTKGLATTLNIASGDTVIIGGLIDKSQDGSLSGLPGLSEVPAIGRALSSDAQVENVRELVLILKARAV